MLIQRFLPQKPHKQMNNSSLDQFSKQVKLLDRGKLWEKREKLMKTQAQIAERITKKLIIVNDEIMSRQQAEYSGNWCVVCGAKSWFSHYCSDECKQINFGV